MDAVKQELIDKRKAAFAVIAELREKTDLNAEETAKWDAANKEYDDASAAIKVRDEELNDAVKRSERFQQLEAEMKATNGDRKIGLDADKRREADPEKIQQNIATSQALAIQAWTNTRSRTGLQLTDEHRAACKQWGINPTDEEISFGDKLTYRYDARPSWMSNNVPGRREVRVGLDISTSGAGMETVPEGFMAELARVTLEYAHVSNVCRIVTTEGGNPLPWPKVDDTSNTGVMLSAATTIGTSVDPTFSAVTFSAYKMSSKAVFVANELLQDSAFNLASELASMLGERLGRIEGSYSTTGTGTSEPKGIVACAGTGVTSATATAFTADELIDLVHSLDISNRGGSSVGFMMHDTCVKYVRKFKDANGQYLWQSGMGAGAPDTLYGYRVVTNQAMEPLVSNVPVTAKKHVLFGDFSKFIVRYAGGTRFYHLKERYRDVDQDAFVAFRRFDSNTIKASALKVLLQA